MFMFKNHDVSLDNDYGHWKFSFILFLKKFVPAVC